LHSKNGPAEQAAQKKAMRFLLRIGASFLIFAVQVVQACSQASSNQTTHGYCSPAFNNTTGDITANCYVTIQELKNGVQSQLDNTFIALQSLVWSQQLYFMPAAQRYVSEPTDANWRSVRNNVARTMIRLNTAIDAAVSFDSALTNNLGPSLTRVHQTLGARESMMAELTDKPMDPNQFEDWFGRYRKQINILSQELDIFRNRFRNAEYRPTAR
jgi:hypothetical protein